MINDIYAQLEAAEARAAQLERERNEAQNMALVMIATLVEYANESNWSSVASEILEPDDEFGELLLSKRIEVELGEKRIFELSGDGFSIAQTALSTAPAQSATYLAALEEFEKAFAAWRWSEEHFSGPLWRELLEKHNAVEAARKGK